MSEELKPCPFCGGNPSVWEKGSLVNCAGRHNADIFPMSKYEWNTRPIEDALQAEVERLTAENARLREELIRMIDTFSGMSSAIPGIAFGSGAIAKARDALDQQHA